MKTTGKRFIYIADALYDGNRSELARTLGIAPQSFSKYTSGDITPGGKIVTKLHEEGVNPKWIVEGVGEPWDVHHLAEDKPWKRLIILRYRSKVFSGTRRIAAGMLGVDVGVYEDWELGKEEIPPAVMDQIFAMISRHIRKEWWYEGEGEMYIDTDDFSMCLDGVEEPPFLYLSVALQKDIEECITELVSREGEHDRKVFGELLKIKLREAGIIPKKQTED